MELVPTTSQGKIRLIQDKCGNFRTSSLFPNGKPTPDGTRLEVSLLKSDFNERLKQAAFNSLCTAYYTAFVPCALAPVRARY